ncbi:MAG: hypothetical protein R3B74_07195 [Nitrospirales bacterium]|nr:hypothetical protein [Nitrospirales bacterium]
MPPWLLYGLDQPPLHTIARRVPDREAGDSVETNTPVRCSTVLRDCVSAEVVHPS